MKTPRIAVVGSINLDLRVHVSELPEPGETVLGTRLARGPGGKGANQAVAAARLGAEVEFVGAVGTDDAGATLRASLRSAGVTTDRLATVPGPSGLALIEVDEAGQNRIVVVSGANMAVTPESLDARSFQGKEVVLLQLELTLDTVRRAAELGAAAGARVILNAAPATRLEAEDLAHVDLLVVNESEASALLAGREDAGAAGAADAGDFEPEAAAEALTSLVPTAIVTLGARGAAWAGRDAAAATLPAFTVDPVDTTGAGDTFVGALGARLGAGDELRGAIRYASAAAALATTREGAQDAAPGTAEVEELLATGGGDDAP